jgi:predicted methyltransferase
MNGMHARSLTGIFVILAACGGSSTPSTTTPTSNAAPTATAASTSTATPPTETTHVSKVDVPAAIGAIVSAADRDADDKKLDEGRHPGEMLAFFGIAPGQHVAELEAGTGYTTELLARTVAPGGVVYAENNKFVLEKFAEKGWTARLAKPVNKLVVRVDRELEDPLPPEAHDLDAVIFVLFYHDTVWLGTDRAKMNAKVFASLKKGGVYGIVDHSGRPGTGSTETQTLHRIEEKVVVDEVKAAGFTLAADAAFLRNPADARDWSASPSKAGEKRGTSDRFVLKFVKP